MLLGLQKTSSHSVRHRNLKPVQVSGEFVFAVKYKQFS